MESIRAEILVLPFFGQGHLLPCIELCKRLSSFHNYNSILIIPSNLSSSVPSSVRHHHHPFLQVVDIPNPGSGSNPSHEHKKLDEGIESFLAERYNNNNTGTGFTRPVCAVIDVMMSSSKEVFWKFGVRVVSFFTSGACSSAVDYAGWIAKVDEIKPGETRMFDGLPESMSVNYSDHKRHHRPRSPPPPPMDEQTLTGPDGPDGGRRKRGPHGPGGKPTWLEEIDGSIAMFFNTCDDIDGPFINYLSNKIDKPVYGIGPLLPEHYWKSFDSVVRDNDVRANHVSNYTEDQVVQWLDRKPSQSVIYVSFGSEVGPTMDEYSELSNALEESNRFFIWVIQPNSGLSKEPSSHPKQEGYYPIGLDKRVGERGLIIKGWAPQLLILSHPSIRGFLSHCGWNSSVEAIGRGVPILAWPIRGDQFHNAKLIVNHLKVGHHLFNNNDDADVEGMVKKNDIIKGINLLMDDNEVYKKAMGFRCNFKNGFPESSVASLKFFLDHVVLPKE